MKTLFCLIVFLLATPVLAVDGYKQFKFGTSLEEIRKTNICTWSDPGYSEKHLEKLFCEDFKFNGKAAMTLFVFIDDKFLRILINIPYSQKDNMLVVLKKKYGASSSPTDEDIRNFNGLPNQNLWYGFDNNTVFLQFVSDNNYKKLLRLFYQSPLFNKVLTDKRTKSLMDAL